MGDDVTTKLQYLLDREAIRDVVTRYCHGVDRLDSVVIASVYWPEATDDHGVFSGPAADFVTHVMEAGGAMDLMQHLVGNMLIRNDGEHARCESYFHAYHRVRGERGFFDHIVGGRYLDELEQREDDWRIIRRKVIFDWFRVYPDSADWSGAFDGAPIARGRRGPGDSASTLFAQDAIDRRAGP